MEHAFAHPNGENNMAVFVDLAVTRRCLDGLLARLIQVLDTTMVWLNQQDLLCC